MTKYRVDFWFTDFSCHLLTSHMRRVRRIGSQKIPTCFPSAQSCNSMKPGSNLWSNHLYFVGLLHRTPHRSAPAYVRTLGHYWLITTFCWAVDLRRYWRVKDLAVRTFITASYPRGWNNTHPGRAGSQGVIAHALGGSGDVVSVKHRIRAGNCAAQDWRVSKSYGGWRVLC